ncbi:hypothetical protein BV22DRAFT_1135793 [Leucogyrophana mollusca]|uniref:Uncharacterized protein n=1 Tax=Leucogyrophana mollusca TaxID=85980 RepID=A0ACB8AUG8_9AGAM|nr:hypothetical protein BV22DRAFT_1135793 [Leucogyrophana mollusca]
MMLQRFPLRTPSGTSQRPSRTGPVPGNPKPTSKGSTTGQKVGPIHIPGLAAPAGTEFLTGPPSCSSSSSVLGTALSSRRGHSRNPSAVSAVPSASGIPKAVPDFSRPPPSPTSSLDDPISIQIGSRRSRESEEPRDPTQLTPRRTKRLKVYANQLAEKHGISKQELSSFIDTGDIFVMLVDIKANLIQKNENQQGSELGDLKELIESTPFQTALKVRLTACLMSPNITAYVTDTQQHIMVSSAVHGVYHNFED